MTAGGSRVEVGVRALKNNLSEYLHRVRRGDEVIVTDRGRPVARLVPLSPAQDHLAELIAAGLVHPPADPNLPVPHPVVASGTVSDLVVEQRR